MNVVKLQEDGRVRLTVKTEDGAIAREMLGPKDVYLRRLREAFNVRATLRGDSVLLCGA